MTEPRSGPCAPWCSAADVLGVPAVVALGAAATEALAAESAAAASGILYSLSGQQFSGACDPVTIRPVSRPVDVDTRAWGPGLQPGSYSSSWGVCSAYGFQGAGIASHYGCSRPPTIDLGAYPVTEIVEVLIDGVVIPPVEYRLQDYRQLVRIRPTDDYTPTDRWGWPTCQILDLPDTQEGTFSVTYRYGQAPPIEGFRAARILAAEMLLSSVGQANRLPSRITTVARQGISMAVVDVMDFLSKGLTGIYEVDLFIRAKNPNKNTRRSLVWSPDLGRPYRMPVADS